ncbi:AAA domain-containing protein, putative AbiEii toxin, Type IV TA system [Burkholderia sp. YR290]|nr:AAA domain-containing protein, putative AbiEii toxin, Type IV TA system [Burkholderia sp. YR290]
MIKYVDFIRFRGFERLRAELLPHAYIVGPNSAGKSTVLEAIGLAERCLRVARRKAPTLRLRDKGSHWRGYPLPRNADEEEDPVRHDFGSEETRVTVHWISGARVHMVWPEEGEDAEQSGFFYLEDHHGSQPVTPQAVKSAFTQVTIIPVITPLDRVEELKNSAYVEQHSATRLASRHFRNNAWMMAKSDQWELFRDFCRGWLPEIELLDVSFTATVNRLVIYYVEPGSRIPKELSWAGDGIQIWVQILWHLFRAKESSTIVLDEPEVYLHPDLQRRLVRLLDTFSAQIILASHSADVIAEAPADGILWVDRRSGGARRAKSQRALTDLSTSLGSSYNLALARSMRSKLLIASDCSDPRILRVLAKQVGAVRVANEQIVSIVPLQDASKWSGTRDLGNTLRSVLPSSVPLAILLLAGHRPKAHNQAITDSLSAPYLAVTIWMRPELENYLVDPDTVAKASGAAPETVAMKLADICWELHHETRSAFISAWVNAAQTGKTLDALIEAEKKFDEMWLVADNRTSLVPGTKLIKHLNLWLEKDGYRTISGLTLAKTIKPQIVPSEIVSGLFEMEGLVT